MPGQAQPASGSPLPPDPDGVTAAWLTSVLHASGALSRGRVVSVEHRPLDTTHGLTGALVRLRICYDGADPDAPRSLVGKFSASDPHARTAIHAMGLYEREVRFYRRLASESPLRTPRCYLAAIDSDSGRSLLLLEDLTAARNGSWAAGCSVAEAELVVRELAGLHAAWWEDDRLRVLPWLQLRGMVAPEQQSVVFDEQWGRFLAKLSVPPTSEVLAAGEWVAAYLPAVCQRLFRQPPLTLIHHDLDGDNLFFVDDGGRPLAVIDWQLTTPARAMVDVAWFLAGHLEPAERRRHERRLIQSYHSALTANGAITYPLDQCIDDYRLALLVPAARLAAAVGMNPALSAHPGAFWDVVFLRYVEALHDHEVGALLTSTFGARRGSAD